MRNKMEICGKIKTDARSATNTFHALTNSTFEVLNMAKTSLPQNHSKTQKGTPRHGLSKTEEYRIFLKAKSRCENPKDTNYPRYGGRGVKFLFTSIREFIAELGPRPSRRHSLDRINVNGHYEPGNVRWATREVQGRNRNDNVRLTLNGITKTIVEWTTDLGLSRSLVYNRLYRGWGVERALAAPVRVMPRETSKAVKRRRAE